VRRLTAALAAAALAAVPAAGCGADDVSPQTAVARAATATQAADTARVAVELAVQAGGLPVPITVRGAGVTSTRGTPRLDVTFDLTPLLRLAGGRGDGRTRLLAPGGATVYLDPPAVEGLRLPGDRRWVSLDLARAARAAGLEPAGLAALLRVDPATQLEGLRAAGAIERVGEEEVGGAPTTHFRGEVRLRDLVRALPADRRRAAERAIAALARVTGEAALDEPVPTELWVDDEGLVRRMRQSTELPGQDGRRGGKVEVSYVLSDFGTPLRARAPARGEVFDATGLATRAIREGVLSARG
jgi:hypothetical protein